MTREEKITAIYKEMANKEDSFGLRFIAKFQDYKDKHFDARKLTTLFGREDEDGVVFREAITSGALLENHYYLDEDAGYIPHIKRGEVLKIIGHPVMIGDVLGWLDSKICLLLDQGKEVEKLLKGSDALNLRLINVWKHKIKPLDEQPDYCIDYVINILDKFGSVI